MMLLYLYNKIIKKLSGKAIRNSKIHSSSKVEAGSQVINTTMDKYSFCGYDCKLLNCTVGSYTSIADRVVIGGAQHPIEWGAMSPVFYYGRDSVKRKFSEHKRDEDKYTSIGHDVWIGEGSYIKAGIKIGDGAVVGMGSVVTKDIGNYEIWAGNPAHKIRDRFDPETKEVLQKYRWWELDDAKIEYLATYITDINVFIEKLKEV